MFGLKRATMNKKDTSPALTELSVYWERWKKLFLYRVLTHRRKKSVIEIKINFLKRTLIYKKIKNKQKFDNKTMMMITTTIIM